MLILLPFISLIFLFFIFLNQSCWRSSVLSAAIVWAVLLTAITEILSLGRLITLDWLIRIWVLIDFTLIFIYLRLGRKKQKYKAFKPSRFSLLLLGSVVFIVLAIGLTALIAPPNNWDSMSYRMARVVHWIQNQSVAFYPTSYLPQLYQKPWAEFTIMHLQILSGGDHFANLVQWFSMVGSLIGVSLIAKQIGADLRGQILSVVVCVTVPMGILQASSTQGDYVVSFWLVCFVYYVVWALEERTIGLNLFKIGASLGLAFFSKGTAYIYAFPFLVWFFISSLKHFGWHFWRPLLIITGIVILINISHELRNIDLFGHPLAAGDDKYTNEIFTVASLLSNVIRNISLHIYIPIQSSRDIIEDLIRSLHILLNIGVSDPRTTWTEYHLPADFSGLFHEDSASNTLHLLLIIGTIIVFLKEGFLRRKNNLSIYLISVITAFLLFCLILKWQPWHSRLHLPLFVLFSPFVGTVLAKISHYYKIVNLLAFILIFSSLFWVLGNKSRPLVAQMNEKLFTPSSYENIFNTSRIEQYFINNREIKKPYIEVTSILNSQTCSNIGLALGIDDWEYPLWVLLQNSKKPYRIEQVDVKNLSAKKSQVYPHNNFVPCAIMSVEQTKVKIHSLKN